MVHFRVAHVCLLAAILAAAPARAGGGPENVLLVVNPTRADSLAVANAFAALRHVPPGNVLMLPWKDGDESVPIDRFRTEILQPILRTIDSRRLAPQIDQVVYSCGFPWRVDYAAELPAELAKQQMFKFPSGSLTGMTMLYAAVQSGGPSWLDPASNRYFQTPGPDGAPATTVGFRGWYGWGERGDVLEVGGSRYLLATMLGVTAGRGNSVREIVQALESTAAADGRRPPGTIYFLTNGDVRTRARSGPVKGTVKAIEAVGVKAEILDGILPQGRRDVAGLVTGTPDFDWPASGSRLLPGAICDNLTSFGAVFTPGAEQTPLSAFIRAGAAGACGTVIEPYVMLPNGGGNSPAAFQPKFPHPAVQLHYVRGASLAEAFYQAVRSPQQLLVVGDPLCQPWAVIPAVEIVNAADSQPLEPGATLTGTLELEPRASLPDGGIADRFELYVDGVRVAQCGLGEQLPLDTTALADGHHDLRVVAIAATEIETQGRRIVPVTVSNHGLALTLAVEPRRVRPADTVRVSLTGAGLESAIIYGMGRVLGRTATGQATIELPAELLGRGPVTLRATGRTGPNPGDAVNAPPVTIEVGD
jgi:hypothetical protein